MDSQETPPKAAPAAATTPKRRWLQDFTFRRSLVTSAAVHVTLVGVALALGLGPLAKEGRLWFDTTVAVAHPESTVAEPPEDLEPEREPEHREPPDPEIVPIDVVEPPPEPLQEPEPELADVLETGDLWASVSLDPLERILPPQVEEVAAEPTEVDPVEPVAAAPVEPAPTAPVIVAAPPPVYPRVSLRLGHEGVVLVRIHVTSSGAIANVEVVESSGHERLDQAALETVRAWRLRPATEGGAAVAGTLLHRVVFRIDATAGL